MWDHYILFSWKDCEVINNLVLHFLFHYILHIIIITLFYFIASCANILNNYRIICYNSAMFISACQSSAGLRFSPISGSILYHDGSLTEDRLSGGIAAVRGTGKDQSDDAHRTVIIPSLPFSLSFSLSSSSSSSTAMLLFI